MNTLKFDAHTMLLAAGVAFAIAFGGAGSALAQAKPGPAPAAGAVPAPKILVIDRNAILRASKVGQNIVQQVSGLTRSAEGEFKAESESLRKEGMALQQQVAILAPDVKAKEAALGPILQGIMQERGANLLLDRSAIVLGTVNIDITAVAVQRLNQKMPGIKVQLTPLPPGLQASLAQGR
jgi:Skp family chaperone for outer membrane proteins